DAIHISSESNIQDGVIVHVDPGFPVKIEEKVTVGHNAILHGCTIKKGSLIGMGAIILNGAVIEEGALVAAGALVLENTIVKTGTLVAGTPAKPIKNLSEKNQEALKRGSDSYIKKSTQF